MNSPIVESVRFTNAARDEMRRLARKSNKIAGDLESEIIDYIVKGAESARNANITISGDDVITYEIAQNVFKSAVFYFDPSQNSFVRIVGDEIGAPPGDRNEDDLDRALDPDRVDKDDADEVKEAEEEGEEDEEEDEDSPEEDELAQEIGHSEASSLRQSHSAIVKKTITKSDGSTKTVTMNPIARLYHLMPKEGVINHTEKIWQTQISPVVNRFIGAKKAGPELYSAIKQPVTALFDDLREETCLTDSEINAIQQTLFQAVNSSNISESASTIQTKIDRIMRKAIATALRNRSNESRVFDYITRSNKIATPDEYIQIDHGLAGNNIIRTRNALESFMSTRNVAVSREERLKNMVSSEAGATAGELFGRSDAKSMLADVSGEGGYEVNNFYNGRAASGGHNEDEMVENLAEKEGTSDFSVFPSLLVSKMGGGIKLHQAVNIKIRTGDTSDTVHNAIRDMADFQKIDKRRKKTARIHTSGAALLREIKNVFTHLEVHVDTLAFRTGDDQFASICKQVRNDTELSSGLIEYFAMSGLDVLPLGKETARERLISVSADMHRCALRMTDAIAREETNRDHRRDKATINADIAAKSKQLRNAREHAADEPNAGDIQTRIQDLQREIDALQRERKESSTLSLYSHLADVIIEQLKLIDFKSIITRCEKYLPNTVVDEQRTTAERDRSRYTIQLAETRVARIASIEMAQKRDLTSRIATAGSSAVASLQMNSSVERYERQVHDTMQKLVSHNQIQMHALLPIDTIDSICEQYKIGVNPTPDDITINFKFTATLPAKFDPDGLTMQRNYEVVGNVATEKKTRSPEVLVRYQSPSGAIKEMVIPKRAIMVALATRNEAASKARAREQFAQVLRFSFIAGLRDISRQIDQAGDQMLMPKLKDDEPLIPQIAETLYESDVTLCQRRIKKGLAGISDSMIDADMPEELAPDPNAGTVINDRFSRALRVLAILSKRVGQGRQFATSVAEALGQQAESSDEDATRRSTLVRQIRGITSVESKVSQLFPEESGIADDFVRLLSEDERSERDVIVSLVQSVNESLSFMTAAQRDLEMVMGKRERREYEEALVGFNIAVPPRGLLVPGATITVVPPKRSIGRLSRETMRVMGVTPNMMLSAPMMGLVASIEYIAFAKALIPMLQSAADDMSEGLFRRMMGVYYPATTNLRGEQVKRELSSSEETSGIAACRDALSNFLMSPITSSENDYLKAEHKAVLQTYRKISSIIGNEDEIGVIPTEKMSAMDASALAARDAVRGLQRAAFDGVARSITSDEGVRKLYTVAPCTAVMLNRLAFNASQMRLYNVLEPKNEEALTTMTADFFREAMSGIQRGKTGREVIFSREIDRIAVAMRVLNDFYTDFKASANAMGTVEAAVIDRLRRKLTTPSMKPNEVASKIAAALGVTEQVRSLDDLKPQARIYAQKISEEMAMLSDTDHAGKLMQVLREIADTSVGTSRQLIASRIKAETAYSSCVSAVNTWIQSTDIITPQEVKKVVTDAPHDALRYGVPQILENISEAAANAVISRYITERQTDPKTSRWEK